MELKKLILTISLMLTHYQKKKKKNPKQKKTLLPMKVLNSIKLKYFCTSIIVSYMLSCHSHVSYTFSFYLDKISSQKNKSKDTSN